MRVPSNARYPLDPKADRVVGVSTSPCLVRYPIHESHQLGCGGVSFTNSHVYSFGFCSSTSSYWRLLSPSVANLFLPVFRYSYLKRVSFLYSSVLKLDVSYCFWENITCYERQHLRCVARVTTSFCLTYSKSITPSTAIIFK